MKRAFTERSRNSAISTSASIIRHSFTSMVKPQQTVSNRFGASRRTGYAARIATWEATICKIISMLTLSAGTGDGTPLRCSTRFLCGSLLRSRRQRYDSGPKNRLEISLSERAVFSHCEPSIAPRFAVVRAHTFSGTNGHPGDRDVQQSAARKYLYVDAE